MKRQTINGVLATGLGQAAGFTSLDWARETFQDRLSIDPFPGTVNLIVESQPERAAWRLVKSWSGIVLPPPRSDWCNARCYHARLNNHVDVAIVLPEIDGYPEDQIELIAAIAVRDTLNLKDGDPLVIEVRDS